MPNWCLVLCICGNVHFTTTVKTHLLWLKFNMISSRLVHWTFFPLPIPQKEKKMTVTFIILENFNRWVLKQDSPKVEGCTGRWLSRDFGEAAEQVCNQELEAASTGWVLRDPGNFTLSSLLRKDSTCWGSGGRQPPCRGPCFACWLWCGTVTSDERSWCRQT